MVTALRGDHLDHVKARMAHKLDLNNEQNLRLQGLAATLRKLHGDLTEHRTQHADEIGRLLAAPTLARNRAIDLVEEGREALSEHSQAVIIVVTGSTAMGVVYFADDSGVMNYDVSGTECNLP